MLTAGAVFISDNLCFFCCCFGKNELLFLNKYGTFNSNVFKKGYIKIKILLMGISFKKNLKVW